MISSSAIIFPKWEKQCCMETIAGDLTAVDYFAKSCLHIQCAATIMKRINLYMRKSTPQVYQHFSANCFN